MNPILPWYLSWAEGDALLYILKDGYFNCSPQRLQWFTFTPTAGVFPFLLFLAQTRYHHKEKRLLSDGHSMFHCCTNFHVTDCQWSWRLTISRLLELKTALRNCWEEQKWIHFKKQFEWRCLNPKTHKFHLQILIPRETHTNTQRHLSSVFIATKY